MFEGLWSRVQCLVWGFRTSGAGFGGQGFRVQSLGVRFLGFRGFPFPASSVRPTIRSVCLLLLLILRSPFEWPGREETALVRHLKVWQQHRRSRLWRSRPQTPTPKPSVSTLNPMHCASPGLFRPQTPQIALGKEERQASAHTKHKNKRETRG